VHEWDARPGGTTHVSLEFDNGPFHATGEFLVAEPPGGGGGLVQGGGRKPSGDGTVVYFNAGPDLDTVLSRVEEAGGKVLMGKAGSRESGYVAFFLDTGGNRVGLQSPS